MVEGATAVVDIQNTRPLAVILSEILAARCSWVVAVVPSSAEIALSDMYIMFVGGR